MEGRQGCTHNKVTLLLHKKYAGGTWAVLLAYTPEILNPFILILVSDQLDAQFLV